VDRSVLFPVKTGDFSVLCIVQNGSRDHSASYLVGIGGCFTSGKVTRHNADHLCPSSTKVIIMCAIMVCRGAICH